MKRGRKIIMEAGSLEGGCSLAMIVKSMVLCALCIGYDLLRVLFEIVLPRICTGLCMFVSYFINWLGLI